MTAAASPPCRACGAPLAHPFVDLGIQPLANALLAEHQTGEPEPRFPLRAMVCDRCLLVQLDTAVDPEAIFSRYPYFSSYSDTWLAHVRAYAEAAVPRFGLDAATLVVEVGSNDGHLLSLFHARGIPVLGVEPARNVSEAARQRGVPTETAFFGTATAARIRQTHGRATLIVANNVLAHVPDLNDFIAGLAHLLDEAGTLTVEFPHLLNLVRESQFDTIYHEHYSYFSLGSAERALARHGLAVVDVDELATHGGSLRLYARHAQTAHASEAVHRLRALEAAAGMDTAAGHDGFAASVARIERELLDFVATARRDGKRLAAYGAAAKGATLLNHCRLGPDAVSYVADKNPHKQGHLLPGSRIPVVDPARVASDRPDYLLILPWNLRPEIMAQMAHVRAWGGRFVTAIPRLEVW